MLYPLIKIKINSNILYPLIKIKILKIMLYPQIKIKIKSNIKQVVYSISANQNENLMKYFISVNKKNLISSRVNVTNVNGSVKEELRLWGLRFFYKFDQSRKINQAFVATLFVFHFLIFGHKRYQIKM